MLHRDKDKKVKGAEIQTLDDETVYLSKPILNSSIFRENSTLQSEQVGVSDLQLLALSFRF